MILPEYKPVSFGSKKKTRVANAYLGKYFWPHRKAIKMIKRLKSKQ